MSQRVDQRDARQPVDPHFDPLDPNYLADPYYARFRREAPALDNLSFEEVVSICYNLSFAGHGTMTNLILNGLTHVAFELLTRRLPDQRFEFDPNLSFRGPKELWAEWTAPAGATGG